MKLATGPIIRLYYQLADGIEVVLLSVLLPVVACQWSLENWEEAFIASVSYV